MFSYSTSIHFPDIFTSFNPNKYNSFGETFVSQKFKNSLPYPSWYSEKMVLLVCFFFQFSISGNLSSTINIDLSHLIWFS